MSESASANAPKPSSSVKLVLLGEAAVGKVRLVLYRVTLELMADREFSLLTVIARPSVRQQ
jgi:Ras-related protein Rab-5C